MNSKNTTVRETKVAVSDLKIGMFVCRLDKDWIDSPFLFQGFLIEDEKLISQLQKECHYVYVDENKYDEALGKAAEQEKSVFSFKSLFGSASGPELTEIKRENTHRLSEIIEHKVATETIIPPKKVVSYDQEIGFAKQTHTKVIDLMNEFASQVKDGGTINILISRPTIYDCMTSVLRSPDAMQLVMRLKSKHQALWQKSMNDAVLALSFGRYLNLDNGELITLGLCGLLHDIGHLRISKQALQEAVNKKPLISGVDKNITLLDGSQEAMNKKQLIRSHTVLGRDILLNCPGQLGQTVAEVAYCHHEHLDGSGFPQGLKGEQISPYTRMISIVDVYNSLTLDGKSETESMTHYDAISLMLKKADSHFDETLLNAFNQCIGAYPVGCVVEMNTGEIAMVVEVNEELKLKPKVMLLTDVNKQPGSKKVINLAECKLSSDGIPYVIKGIVRPEKYGIKL